MREKPRPSGRGWIAPLENKIISCYNNEMDYTETLRLRMKDKHAKVLRVMAVEVKFDNN